MCVSAFFGRLWSLLVYFIYERRLHHCSILAHISNSLVTLGDNYNPLSWNIASCRLYLERLVLTSCCDVCNLLETYPDLGANIVLLWKEVHPTMKIYFNDSQCDACEHGNANVEIWLGHCFHQLITYRLGIRQPIQSLIVEVKLTS